MTSQSSNAKKSRKVTFLCKNEKNNQSHFEGGMRESHPHVKDLQHQLLGKPSHGSQILDTRMGFPCSYFNVAIYSINHYVVLCIAGTTKMCFVFLYLIYYYDISC